MSWLAPTYKTAHGLKGNPLVRCTCGRQTNADMMRDMRPLAAQLRASLGRFGAPDFICDGCEARMIRRKLVSRLDLAKARGAPQEVLAKITALQAADKPDREP